MFPKPEGLSMADGLAPSGHQTPVALPAGAGVCLKPVHYRDVLAGASADAPAFFEIHAENYLHPGGPAHRYLEAIRRDHRLSVHGVGLSLGGPGMPSDAELKARAALVARYQPDQFSEHLAWCRADGEYFNDLLPVAYTRESLAQVVRHVSAVQESLGQRILIENPATYLRFATSTLSEPEFITELVRISGCGLLLDVNNIIVSANNHGFDPYEYLDALPLHAVGEVHLAGHAVRNDSAGRAIFIDSHDGPVQEVTWSLYQALIARIGAAPTLIEWDSNLPDYPALLEEGRKAREVMLRAQTPMQQAAARTLVQPDAA
jgi:uncharacterized protein (UPF0276 family)